MCSTPAPRLRDHLPEYLLEGLGLGLFMASAALFGVLLFHPSALATALPDPFHSGRRAPSCAGRCKAHDLDNLYVVDASFFVSSTAVNPALTIMANALRVGDHLLERLGAARQALVEA